MTASAPIILLGLDAFDPGLARRYARSGELSTLRRLFETGARSAVRNPFGLFVGALWANFATGLRPDRHRFHCWDEIEVRSYRHRPVTPELEAFPKFWDEIAKAGFEVAAVDVPHMRLEGEPGGVRIFEWGCHDRHFGLQCRPPEREGSLGLHPILGFDSGASRNFAADDFTHRAGPRRTLKEEARLLRGLLDGAAMKAGLLASLLAERDWDLLVGVFGESHAVGHQQWHLHDERHPRFDAATRDAIGGDPVLQVYRRIDEGLGEVLGAAPADAAVLVLLSHGMGPHHDGVHLLDELLTRLDRRYRGGAAAAGLVAEPLRALLPWVRAAADRIGAPAMLRRPLAAWIDRSGSAPSRARQLFFSEPNNYVYGGIRLNLIGREPHGQVDPAEADAMCERLAHDLLELENSETGGPVVRSVIRSDRHYRRAPDDTMPDLFVDWERGAKIETVTSPRIGTVHVPYTGWRTGDHREDGLLLALGPGFPAGEEMPPVAVEDIGPSIAARFGVAPGDVDGRIVPWLTRMPARV